MAVLMAADVYNKAMDYTMVTLIAVFLMLWLVFYLFNVTWRDDDDEFIESHVWECVIHCYYNIINLHDLPQVEELSTDNNGETETNKSSRFGWRKLFRSNRIIDVPIKSEEMERRQHAFEDL